MLRNLFFKSVGIMLALLLVVSHRLEATHIRAGEIIAVRISNSNLTYKFTVIGYTDLGSVVTFGEGEIDFGDGTVVRLSDFSSASGTVDLGDEIAYNYFEIEHTFAGAGKFTVRYNEKNRNAGVVNMANSVDTPFYIETVILIDPFIGLNDTPVFLVPPIDRGAVGAVFLHNPGAYDSDGDSLSYRLTVPKQFLDRDVNAYLSPIDPSFYADFENGNQEQDGRPTFGIDPANGDLVWDAPGKEGEYNIAFVVDEWRLIQDEWFLLGSVTRDMQIIIEETDNEPPEIIAPDELCVEAGTLIDEIITATDPDGDPVKIEGFGGPFQLVPNNAELLPGPAFRESPSNVSFLWQTNCDMVRDRPYEVRLKATDKPDLGPKLVDFKTWSITIVAPAPTGLTASALSERRIKLDWDSYSCGTAENMQIWRRVDSFDFTPEECVVGIPDGAGYQLIDTVSTSINTYLDDNAGLGLAAGANYCYRIVAIFPAPLGGKSYASNEACQEILITAPVIIEVDVEKTSKTDGQIFIRWQEPTDLDPVLFPPSEFRYDIVRYKGASGMNNPDTLQKNMTLKHFTDSGLDTESSDYHYMINLYNGTAYVDKSFPASSVWLDATASESSISIAWSAQVPWSNLVDDHPFHIIYRNRADFQDDDLMVKIDSVDVTLSGMKYEDDGSFNDEPLDDQIEYSYYVETKGSYGNDDIETPLLNKSQIVMVQPNDGVAPCEPITLRLDDGFDCKSFLATRGCAFSDFTNQLYWDLNEVEGCDDDVRSFNIYFSESGDEADFGEAIANVTVTEYLHTGLNSFKGCYRISAVDRSGNESELSEMVCNDNCPNIVFPNAFSPNGDDVNDVFTPYSDVVGGAQVPEFDLALCPRFVKTVEFVVFNRAGAKLFEYHSARAGGENINDIMINWDGKTNNGQILPAGAYYYGAEITFDVLNEANSKVNYRGWLQVVR